LTGIVALSLVAAVVGIVALADPFGDDDSPQPVRAAAPAPTPADGALLLAQLLVAGPLRE
jgi:hypothetical protein